MDYSDGISKFIFDPGVHRPHSTPKPLSTPTGRYGPLWAPLIKSAWLRNPLDCAAKPESEQARCQPHFTLTLFQQLTTGKNKECNWRCAIVVFVPGAMLCCHGDF
ncbi:hypothetical protein T08_15849 [Trichinella sp. T8]|nr:hypothetical protein T08_15849 [Trichinella sp. T8]